MEAFAANTIPIYFGNPEIAKEFNSEAFINCHDYDNFDDVVKKIREIDSDKDTYMKMLSANPLLKEDLLDNSDLEDYLVHIFEQDVISAGRRPHNTRTVIIEDEQKFVKRNMIFYKMKKKLRAVIRKIDNSVLLKKY